MKIKIVTNEAKDLLDASSYKVYLNPLGGRVLIIIQHFNCLPLLVPNVTSSESNRS